MATTVPRKKTPTFKHGGLQCHSSQKRITCQYLTKLLASDGKSVPTPKLPHRTYENAAKYTTKGEKRVIFTEAMHQRARRLRRDTQEMLLITLARVDAEELLEKTGTLSESDESRLACLRHLFLPNHMVKLIKASSAALKLFYVALMKVARKFKFEGWEDLPNMEEDYYSEYESEEEQQNGDNSKEESEDDDAARALTFLTANQKSPPLKGSSKPQHIPPPPGLTAFTDFNENNNNLSCYLESLNGDAIHLEHVVLPDNFNFEELFSADEIHSSEPIFGLVAMQATPEGGNILLYFFYSVSFSVFCFFQCVLFLSVCSVSFSCFSVLRSVLLSVYYCFSVLLSVLLYVSFNYIVMFIAAAAGLLTMGKNPSFNRTAVMETNFFGL